MNIKHNNLEAPNSPQIFDDWIPRQAVKDFFNYGNTKMSTFASDHNIRMAKVGNRIFYRYSDIVKVIDERLHKH